MIRDHAYWLEQDRDALLNKRDAASAALARLDAFQSVIVELDAEVAREIEKLGAEIERLDREIEDIEDELPAERYDAPKVL